MSDDRNDDFLPTTDSDPQSPDLTELTELEQLIVDRFVLHLSESELMRKYKCSRPTIYRRLRQPEALEIRYRLIPQAARRGLAVQWSDAAYTALKAMDAKKLNDSRALELAKVAGIATDKLQLLTGNPTEIVEHRQINAKDLLDFLKEVK